ncbi:MAG: hypothetical protein AABZ47_17080 [Planctomycetota bacterium]
MISVRCGLVGLTLVFVIGCQGSGTVHMVALGTKKIGPTEPLMITVHPQECHAWVNEKDELCVSMRHGRRSILGRLFGQETTLSLVLGPPPAGDSRDYTAGRSTLRARRRQGLSHVRAMSLTGAAAVWDFDKSTIRGRFRILAKQQSFSVLTGWSGDSRIQYVGEFKADRNAASGKRLLDFTEDEVMSRDKATR